MIARARSTLTGLPSTPRSSQGYPKRQHAMIRVSTVAAMWQRAELWCLPASTM
jgi:hypothetical protein